MDKLLNKLAKLIQVAVDEPLIKVEPVIVKKSAKVEDFRGFKATIGKREIFPLPIGFLRLSEIPKLQEMLQIAFNLGRYSATT